MLLLMLMLPTCSLSALLLPSVTSVVSSSYNNTKKNVNTPFSFESASAPQYYPLYSGTRKVFTMDGTWSTGQLGSIENPPTGFDSMDLSFSPTSSLAATPNKSFVPACVDNTPPGYLGYRGVTMFRTTFDFNLNSAPARIQFQACSFYCRIWVNGVEIGDHRAGGYVAFSLEIPSSVGHSNGSSVNELFVLADNRFNSTTAPMHTGGDFWHYGGIMRSVEIHALPPPPSDSFSFSTSLLDSAEGGWPWRSYILPTSLKEVNMTVQLTNMSFTGDLPVTIVFDGSNDSTISASITKTGKAVNGLLQLGIVEVPNPRVWSMTDPQLHTVTVTLNGASVTERFGLRQFGVDKATSRLTVNGEIVKLHGWNHHTQWPNTSASPTEEQMDADIILLKRGGANYVRGAHYPQDPRWLDRLDEAGMVMWCETLGPGVSTKDTQNPEWMTVQEQQLNEMLDNALNHPAIMTWGWFNEGPSNDAEACPAYQRCADITTGRDPTRFVTWASDKDLNDKCLEFASLISFNNYPGWYSHGTPSETWNHFANSVRAGIPSGAKGKPFVISETGAGGIYEWSNNKTDAKWTCNYQTEIISQDVDTALSNSNISGITLWHFFDFKTNDATENNTHCEYEPNIYPPTCAYIDVNNGRPGGENHKGVIGFWRRAKPAYNVVAAKYNASKR
jgi:beta-glucuronidase